MLYSPSEELLERLASPDVTEADVFTYLKGQYDALEPFPKFEHMRPEAFFNSETDLVSFRAAKAWWPRSAEVPSRLVCPTLFMLCWQYETGPTFAKRLTERSLPVVKWLESEGIDVNSPNESVDERKARLNREGQRRYRASKKDGPVADHAKALKEAWQSYLDACAHRRQSDAQLRDEVKTKLDYYNALKNKAPDPET